MQEHACLAVRLMVFILDPALNVIRTVLFRRWPRHIELKCVEDKHLAAMSVGLRGHVGKRFWKSPVNRVQTCSVGGCTGGLTTQRPSSWGIVTSIGHLDPVQHDLGALQQKP